MRLLALVLLLLTLCGAQAATPPDLVLQGELHGEDMHTYRRVPIKVPEGVSRMTLQVEYTGRQEHTVIDLGLLGPDGHLVGWSGGNKKVITISAVDATPSYIPTPTVAGEWNLLLGIPNIRPHAVAAYTAQVWFSRGLSATDEPEILRQPLRRDASWYRGDFHMHTGQSDGACPSMSGASVPCPVFVTVEAAVTRKLDFIAVTEHNTASHANELRELQPYFDRLLLLPGREVTTFYGHANLFGSVAPLNFRVAKGDHADWSALLDEIAGLGGVLSINHPRAPTGEICMGCGWGNDADFSRVQAIEAVNGVDADSALISGVPFWQDLLQKGLRPTAIGGSDNHQGGAGNKNPVGVPTTVVHADELSQVAILRGVRAGHVFIDTDGTPDRLLEFSAQAEGAAPAMMGDSLAAPDGHLLRFDVHVAHAAGASIRLVMDAREVKLLRDALVDADDVRRGFTWPSDGKRHWIRVEVRAPGGHLMLLGNPIYLNPQLPLQ